LNLGCGVILNQKKGETFLDVGAHVGKYALKIAKVVGDGGLVVAFEPMPNNYRALIEGTKLNDLNNVIALDKAAWNKKCELRLFVAPSTYTSSIKTDFSLGYVKVVAETIDNVVKSLGIKRVDWIKVDVEKAEIEVLQGAQNTLENYSPKLVVEIWKGNEAEVFGFMKKLNYNARATLFFQKFLNDPALT